MPFYNEKKVIAIAYGGLKRFAIFKSGQVVSYSITTNVSNGTFSGASTIIAGETATITITPNTNYSLPSSITVSGASYTYNSTTGVIVLTNPTANVTISAECVAILPQLATPTISLSNDTLSIEEVENAEYYDIYVDGVLKESISAND